LACLAIAVTAAVVSLLFSGADTPPDQQIVLRLVDIALEAGIVVTKRTTMGRVIETFPFFMELDLLEIRLNELKDVVDYHLLIESAFTQRGHPKPFFFNRSKHQPRFAPFLHKIIHVMIKDKPMQGTEDGDLGYNKTKWANEFYVRDKGLALGLEKLPAEFAPTAADMLLVNDADEIPTKEAVQFLREYEGYPRFTGMAFRWTFFGFFWKMLDAPWGATSHAVPLHWAMMNSYHWTATSIRMGKYGIHPGDKWMLGLPTSDIQKAEELVQAGSAIYGGWHCTYCFPLEFFALKVQ
jgi:beta-1,4-mannosyl-glycoprotein beta-1,4-N-acetylglucosaminyltransferase